MRLTLRFAGCPVIVESDDAALCERLGRDFAYYRADAGIGEEAMVVTAEQREPDWAAVRGRYLFRKFNGDVFGWGERRWVRYADALVFYDAWERRGRVMAVDPELVYHYTYYLVIAKVGEALDERGLHRLHALGVSIGGRTALLPMPISGGKTTLALAMLEDRDVRLYSEDTPLIDRRGRVHPFAIRLALREGQAAAYPSERLRVKQDPVFGVKYLLDLAHYGLDRVEGAPGERPVILWGRKAGRERPELRRMGGLMSLALLMLFVGTGKDCPQRAEVLVRVSPAGLGMMARVVASRVLAAVGLWRASESYWFEMSPDAGRNAAFVKGYLAGESAAGPE